MGNELLRDGDDLMVAIWINEHFHDGVIGDLGCGNAGIISYLQKFKRKVWGVDSQVDNLGDVPSNIDFQQTDLSQSVKLKKADIILSLEVGEHLPRDTEDMFLENLFYAEPKVIIMSVATTGQTAKSHTNLKPRKVWIEKIEKQGFKEDETLEYQFKKDLDGQLRVKKWYYWNIIIFKKCV
jgi:hypothetical protein